MSNYQLYEEILTSVTQGTPLWEPGSTHSPSVGDVGYLRQGAFIRLFNVTLPPGHKDNENGEPENHTPLIMETTSVQRTVLPKGIIAASGVQTDGLPQNETDNRIHFKCTNKTGAVVMTDSDVQRQDVDVASLATLRDYMGTHVYSWAKFARFQLMHEVALHELILLTGCDLTTGQYSVTAFSSAHISKKATHTPSFQLSRPASKRHFWSHSPEIGNFHHNYGPGNTSHHMEQCLFVRGFKVLDRRVRKVEQEAEAASWVVDICSAAPHRSSVDAVLRYLTDKFDTEIAIAHDNDITKLLYKENIPCDYRSLLKKLRKGRRPVVTGNTDLNTMTSLA